MNRGSSALSDRNVIAQVASMRPRFMNRGSTSGEPFDEASRPSFNEAPIHESGKSDKSTQLTTGVSGFNEAPIHESGK